MASNDEPRYTRLLALQADYLEQVNAILGGEEDKAKRIEQFGVIESLVRSLSYQIKRIGFALRAEIVKETHE
jgi:hypothetical protein